MQEPSHANNSRNERSSNNENEFLDWPEEPLKSALQESLHVRAMRTSFNAKKARRASRGGGNSALSIPFTLASPPNASTARVFPVSNPQGTSHQLQTHNVSSAYPAYCTQTTDHPGGVICSEVPSDIGSSYTTLLRSQPPQFNLNGIVHGVLGQQGTSEGKNERKAPGVAMSWSLRQPLSHRNAVDSPRIASEENLPPRITLARRPLTRSSLLAVGRMLYETPPISLPTLSTSSGTEEYPMIRTAPSSPEFQPADMYILKEDVSRSVKPTSTTSLHTSTFEDQRTTASSLDPGLTFVLRSAPASTPSSYNANLTTQSPGAVIYERDAEQQDAVMASSPSVSYPRTSAPSVNTSTTPLSERIGSTVTQSARNSSSQSLPPSAVPFVPAQPHEAAPPLGASWLPSPLTKQPQPQQQPHPQQQPASLNVSDASQPPTQQSRYHSTSYSFLNYFGGFTPITDSDAHVRFIPVLPEKSEELMKSATEYEPCRSTQPQGSVDFYQSFSSSSRAARQRRRPNPVPSGVSPSPGTLWTPRKRKRASDTNPPLHTSANLRSALTPRRYRRWFRVKAFSIGSSSGGNNDEPTGEMMTKNMLRKSTCPVRKPGYLNKIVSDVELMRAEAHPEVIPGLFTFTAATKSNAQEKHQLSSLLNSSESLGRLGYGDSVSYNTERYPAAPPMKRKASTQSISSCSSLSSSSSDEIPFTLTNTLRESLWRGCVEGDTTSDRGHLTLDELMNELASGLKNDAEESPRFSELTGSVGHAMGRVASIASRFFRD